jgi:hypothetical protein
MLQELMISTEKHPVDTGPILNGQSHEKPRKE